MAAHTRHDTMPPTNHYNMKLCMPKLYRTGIEVVGGEEVNWRDEERGFVG